MNCFQIGTPNRESLPRMPSLLFHVQIALSCTTIMSAWTVFLPFDDMPSNRPNLMLDEQSFQGLLAAAFTIQEHNERIRQERKTSAEYASRSATEATGTCPRCGAPKPAEAEHCQNCSRDEFRPGERLQRNWASMWMMSQEQGLWPDPPHEAGEAASRIR